MTQAVTPRRTRISIVLWTVNVLLFIVLVPLLSHGISQPIHFNQFAIQRLVARHHPAALRMHLDWVRSAHASGRTILLRRPRREAPPFDDKQAMFEYVFRWLPSYAVAYPTEGFYYFRLTAGDRDIAGNLRLADLDAGRITFAYFDAETLEVVLNAVGAEHGLAVTKHGDHLYDVEYAGRKIRFRLTDIADRPPRKLRLIEDEVFIGQVFDESGVCFFLLFNTRTDSFYYVLNDERGTTERLTAAGDEFLIGRRTGFLYYDDPIYQRRLLVALDFAEVVANTVLDGPPDQVPFRTPIRQWLYRAYPRYALGDGVDETGVLVRDGEWARVAIAPVHQYVSVPEVVADLRRIVEATEPGSIRWSALTKEGWNTVGWLEDTRRALEREGKPFTMPRWVALLGEGRFPDLAGVFADRLPAGGDLPEE